MVPRSCRPTATGWGADNGTVRAALDRVAVDGKVLELFVENAVVARADPGPDAMLVPTRVRWCGSPR